MKKSEFIKYTSTKGMSKLDKWYLLEITTEMLAAATIVLFPFGKYKPIKWHHIGRLIRLGKILIVMILKWVKK